MYLVHRHPQPVDDCPCFEDAIAFISVEMGEHLTRWVMARYGIDKRFLNKVMPGSPVGTWSDMYTWWSIAALKMVTGEAFVYTSR